MVSFLLSTLALAGGGAALAVVLALIFRDLVLPTAGPRIDSAGLRWQVSPARRDHWAGVAFLCGIGASVSPAMTLSLGLTNAVLIGVGLAALTLAIPLWARRCSALRVDAHQLRLDAQTVDLVHVEAVTIRDGCVFLRDARGKCLLRIRARGSGVEHLTEISEWIRAASEQARALDPFPGVPLALQRLRRVERRTSAAQTVTHGV